VNAFEMRPIPTADEIKFARPARRVAAQHANGRFELLPVLGGRRRRSEPTQSVYCVGAFRNTVEETSRRTWPEAG
jgi:hypothetical protein